MYFERLIGREPVSNNTWLLRQSSKQIYLVNHIGTFSNMYVIILRSWSLITALARKRVPVIGFHSLCAWTVYKYCVHNHISQLYSSDGKEHKLLYLMDIYIVYIYWLHVRCILKNEQQQH